MIIERRSRPIITLSLAISKQSIVTAVRLIPAAWIAASLLGRSLRGVEQRYMPPSADNQAGVVQQV